MRAAIDIGSNSIRLAMQDGTKRSKITKLADGLEKSGVLSPAGIADSLAVLSEYAQTAENAGCDPVTAFATEAVRRAADGENFIRAVKEKCGLDIKLLSPETEARLALYGATKPSGKVSVCDLGGGSMELISSADGIDPEYIKSLPLGVVVLKNKFSGGCSPRDAYRRAIDCAPELVAEYGKVKRYPLVMLGGSACTIAAGMLALPYYDSSKVNGFKITARELDDFMPILTSPHLSTLRPVCTNRADTVAFGAIIIQALLDHIGVNEFTVSDSSNLDAVLDGFEF